MNTIYDAKILIVDDNADLLALLCEQLRGAGYGKIRTAQSCGGARAAFAAGQPELMILDINLPDGDGFSLFRALRAKADVPALFLSARDADADRLFGLGLGGGRLPDKALFDAGAAAAGAAYSAAGLPGGIVSCKTNGIAAWAAQRRPERCCCQPARWKNIGADGYRAGPAAQAGRKPGHIVTYDAICDAVWGADYYGYENSLGVHIRHLREKLETEPGAPRFLRTVRGIGYKLTKEGEP